MALADYAHWNEDAEYMWWQEEGRHIEEPPEPDEWQDDYDRWVWEDDDLEEDDEDEEDEA